MTSLRRSLLLTFVLLLLIPAVAPAATVEVVGSPFPSDLFTVSDPSHLTGLRVNLPLSLIHI